MADVQQMKKIVPFITCAIKFGRKCLRVGVWSLCNECESWGPDIHFVTISLAIELVLDEIRQIRCVRPVVPCFAPPLVFVSH